MMVSIINGKPLRVHVLSRGETYTSDTPEQMVGLLWKSAFVLNTSPGEYMKAVARRVKMYDGTQPRTHNARVFLADLASSGIIDIEWGSNEQIQAE